MQENKVIKQAIGPDMLSVSFIGNLAIEMTRRLRGMERPHALIGEFQERFGSSLGSSEVYTLLTEVQKRGADIEPNEWIFATPVEYRMAMMTNLGMIKTAKTYGSRTEDVYVAADAIHANIKVVKAWLAENDTLKRTSPQTYYSYQDQLMNLQNQLTYLDIAAKLCKSSVLYDISYSAAIPLTRIGMEIDKNVYFYMEAPGQTIIRSAVTDLTDIPLMNRYITADDTEATPLENSVKKEVALKAEFMKLEEALPNFFTPWLANDYGDVPEDDNTNMEATVQNMSDAVSSLAEYIAANKGGTTLTPVEKDDAFKVLKTFVDNQNEILTKESPELKIKPTYDLNNTVKDLGEKATETKEDATLNANKDVNNDIIDNGLGSSKPAEVSAVKPGTTPLSGVAKNKARVITSAEFDHDISNSLKFLDRITAVLSAVRSDSKIPKTAQIDFTLNNMQSNLKEVKMFIQEELPYQGHAERLASRTLLSNLSKKLSSALDLYTNEKGTDEMMKYISSADFVATLKHANTMLSTLGV